MKNIFVSLFLVFCMSFLYLHQKISVHVQAYQLNRNYTRYKDLVDQRDYLLQDFSSKVSLDKINLWAKDNGFDNKQGEVLIAMKKADSLLSQAQPSESGSKVRIFAGISRYLGLPGESEAIAQDK